MDLSTIVSNPKKIQQFNKKDIYTTEDLISYLPKSYNDFRQETGLLGEDETSVFVMKTEKMWSPSQAGRVPYFRVLGTVFKTGEKISVTFFQQNYLARELAPLMGTAFMVAGKVKYSEQYGYGVSSPELFVPMGQGIQKIYPIYRKIPGMSMEYLTDCIKKAMGMPDLTRETLPVDTVQQERLLSRKEAYYYLHYPNSMENIEKAKERVLFEDLLYFALHNEWAKRASSPVSPAVIMETQKMQEVIQSLPYQLTEDQKSTLDDMVKNAKAHTRIHALVQGDVGCGKTIIAILSMVMMAENGYQSVLMAPTQVLAQQHYEELVRITAPFGFHTVFLGASQKAKERNAALKQIASGEADFVVGTNSVIGANVIYKNLGVTITDEEHKFGVAQRAALVKKAAEGVHSITMSATPIPRTLAQVIHGASLQLYSIHTMPNGRKPVITGMVNTMAKLYAFIIREAKQGHQTYVVCPMIEEKDEDVQSVESLTKQYQTDLGPYGIRIATLTGRNKKQETDEILERFKNGEIDVLISTTVVEVGVNVPTATCMVISNAERFGLASLHQLRGRVGRGDLQSFCVLDCRSENDAAKARMNAMISTNDGFKIAEEDLKLRGGGDILGTKQSGSNEYIIQAMLNPEMYEKTVSLAKKFLENEVRCTLMDRVREERKQADAISTSVTHG